VSVLVLGTAATALVAFTDALAAKLGAAPGFDRLPAPDSEAAAFEAWRERLATGPPAPRIVVAVWHERPRPAALVDLADAEWEARAEAPLLAWNVALGAAAARCADGGAIVAVVEAPGPLESAGWVPEAGLADAVSALVRSVAQAEGPRGVRANTLVTPARIGPAGVAGLAPGYPGTLEGEVLDAAQWLLSDNAGGISGHTLAADFGRTW